MGPAIFTYRRVYLPVLYFPAADLFHVTVTAFEQLAGVILFQQAKNVCTLPVFLRWR